jgi:chromosome segregation ATPase
MLLDELLAQRAEAAAAAVPEPVLAIDPVAVPPAGEVGRRTARQRMAKLEDAARRNLRSAEEARRVLALFHEQRQNESSARVRAESEAAALRRELDRLRASEEKRAARAERLASRSARAELGAEHGRVVDELHRLQTSISDHDRLIDDYAARLREEQAARAALRAELDQSEIARRLAERSLERAVASARLHAEDEVSQLSSADAAVAEARRERDRLADELAALRAADATAALRAELAEVHAALERARADSDELRAHAAALGDELAAARAQIARRDGASAAADTEVEPERPPLARRTPRRGRAAAAVARTDAPVTAPPGAEPSTDDIVPATGFRRTVMAEFTALASTKDPDDFTFRRQQ